MLSSSADVVIIRGSISGTDEEELLPLDLEIQVMVDMGPIGEIDGAAVPRFDSNETTPMTVIESTSSQTTRTAPYVLSMGGFDTGIAVSNMSLTGANFSFYMNGEVTDGRRSTSASLYMGGYMETRVLDSNHVGAAVNDGERHELAAERACSGGETPDIPVMRSSIGYMTITTDFSGGEGVKTVFISDFSGFTSEVRLRLSKPSE